jgi:protein arginine N-methyltransferase 5
MPMSKRTRDVEIINEESSGEEESSSTWYRWRAIRTLCEENARLGLILEMGADLPSDEEVTRWLSEPIKALVVPTELFLTNKSGFPVLSKAHQNFINKFLRVNY